MPIIFDYVFLICSERSGSNLLTRLLDAHSEICGPTPTHLLRILSENEFRYGDLEELENWNAFKQDVTDLMGTKFGVWRTSIEEAELSDEREKRNVASVVRYLYEKESRYAGKRMIFVKENHAYNLIPFLLNAFPKCKFIYLVRDPRDMALSWKKSERHRTLEKPGGIRDGARVWQRDQEASIRVVSQLKPFGRVAAFRYEDLVSSTTEVLTRICSFLGVEIEKSMVDFHLDRNTRENALRVKVWKNLAKPIMKENLGKFRKELEDAEIEWIERLCWAEMNALGYTPRLNYPKDTITLDKEVELIERGLVNHRPGLDAQEDTVRARRRRVISRIENRGGLLL